MDCDGYMQTPIRNSVDKTTNSTAMHTLYPSKPNIVNGFGGGGIGAGFGQDSSQSTQAHGSEFFYKCTTMLSRAL